MLPRSWFLPLFAVLWTLATGAPAASAACANPMAVPDVAEKGNASSVTVMALSVNPYRLADRVRVQMGAGFVYAPGDLIVTNAHVVRNARLLMVSTMDSQKIEAKLVGTDSVLDLAVLRIAKPFAPPLPLAEDGPGRPGDTVVGIGAPLGLEHSVSVGVISAIDRVVPRSTLSYLQPFIQTDAATTHGNSGGPLLNLCGEVIGVNTLAAREGPGIGLAVPAALVRQVIPELIGKGHVVRAWHGLYGQMLSPLTALLNKTPFTEGFLVETVEPGSPADKLGMKGGTMPIRIGLGTFLIGGEVITEVDGVKLDSLDTVRRIVGSFKVGQTVHFTYFSRERGVVEAQSVLPERPEMATDLPDD